VDPTARASHLAVATLGIPTKDRPESLHRCLAGHLDDGRRRGRRHDYVIVDDSAASAVRARHREMLRALGDRYGAAIGYAGPEERAGFAAALVRRAGLPPEAVQFALLNPEGCPVATGASRNALLLHTAGDLLVQVDDDTLCELAAPPGARPGLALSSRHDPTQFWFFGPGEALPCGGPDQVDLLAVHEQLLGKRPAECAASVDVGQATAALQSKLASGGGRVVVTAAGVVGDSGMGSSTYLLTLDGDSRSRLLRSEGDYRHALAGHRVLRAVPRTTLCERAFCVAMNLGLDNRDLLPPFLPVQRNQDGVFAALVGACLGGGWFGFLPWALRHEPPAAARAAGRGVMPRVGTGHLLQVLVRAVAPGPAGPDAAKNLHAVGRALAEWGGLSPAAFQSLVRSHLGEQLQRQAALLADRLRQFGGLPEFWAQDARQVLAHMHDALAGESYATPWDLAEAFGPARAGAMAQRLVLRTGQMLQNWPALVEAARDLRRTGIRLAGRP
jgi:hypothetical protein